MTKYTNQFKKLGSDEVIHEFQCTCPPGSGSHERMVLGATRNMRDDAWLDDGNPVDAEPVTEA